MTSTQPKYVHESGKLRAPALLVHGGAGTFERLHEEGARARLEEGIATAVAVGWEVLERGGAALLAAVEAVASLEDSGLFNAGRGSTLTSDGTLETDASVMDGATKAAGAICAATFPANPVRAALLLATPTLNQTTAGPRGAPNAASAGGPAAEPKRPDGGAWHALLLAGAGADRLAEAGGLTSMAIAGRTGVRAVAGTAAGGRAIDAQPADAASVPSERDGAGTVGAVALDGRGHLAAATSTGGLAGKPPGRVGDSAIIGAGTWADDRTVAVSATGVGEAFILAGFAHRVDWSIRTGADLDDAMASALDEVSLHNGSGGAIALTPSGRFAAIFGTRAMARGWRSAGDLAVHI
jgi:L-asparaginase / beta-aspartyl-peptidase